MEKRTWLKLREHKINNKSWLQAAPMQQTNGPAFIPVYISETNELTWNIG